MNTGLRIVNDIDQNLQTAQASSRSQIDLLLSHTPPLPQLTANVL